MRKTTLKDIAKAADVSVATVSYVLNNSPKQTIPAETRCRVLEAAKSLHYVPNLAARSLVKQKSGLIGILINRAEKEAPWTRLRYAQLVDQLERLLTAQGYHVILSSLDADEPKVNIISERKLDGVFVIDAKKESFHLISHHFSEGVPLIVMDSMIDDSLFYKINYHYEAALSLIPSLHSAPEPYLVIERRNNAELLDFISSRAGIDPSQVHLAEEEEALKQFLLQQKGKNGIIVNEFTAAFAAKYTDPASLTVICTAGCPELVPAAAARITYGSRMAEAACELMLRLINDSMDGPSSTNIYIDAVNS